MPFHRFEDLEAVALTPHLSSAVAPVIEGNYLYYCLNQKKAGTGSELHYHPNELLIFTLEGTVNAVIGKDRQIVKPGTFILIPSNVRHSLKATEDGPCAYLYIKDQTWSVVGIAADEALPDKPMTLEEVNRKFSDGEISDRKGAASTASGEPPSEIIIEGVPNCYYPILTSLDEPLRAGKRVDWIEGELCAFGFFELPAGYEYAQDMSAHERFIYVLQGKVDADVAGERKSASKGDIIQVPLNASFSLNIPADEPTRLVEIRSTAFLQDTMEERRREFVA
ncbi:cupin domain-containing protein [Aureimonas fodinaquatilis]|uniref:Cupin domain-containing protein n=1 Tax=Aureimonas fodinaquatilis TaxID=2565783 RepID=A0A5B0E1S6_9HYPH|nr:cupin domain-containing protein [Aureimonas fodinaquatilis]KAA0972616.1 cupin domain-containing protein [Aureimonas fodinaquatilis]